MTTNPFDNPEFRKEFQATLADALGPLARKVEAHDRDIQRAKGAVGVFAVLWTGLIASAEYLMHRR